MQEECTKADEEVKGSIKRDKRDYTDNSVSQAEEASVYVYTVTKKFAGKFQKKDKDKTH